MKKINKTTIQSLLISVQKEYIKCLEEKLDSVVPVAWHHGWRSTRYEIGCKLRKKIADLECKLK